MELQGKAAVVTGAAGNLGAACARRLVADGAAVVVSDLAETGVQGVVDEIDTSGRRAIWHEGDVSNERDVETMISTCLEEFGRIDALVNVAAAMRYIQQDRRLEDIDVELWDHVMAVNVRGAMLCCKHAIPAMVAQGQGSIVNFTSTAAYAGDDGLIAYSTSKAALLGLTRSVATTYGRQGIRCNALAPSGVWPESTKERMGKERLELMEQSTLTPRLGVPDDVANMVSFLASDRSSYVTGQTMFVDGGGLAHQPWVRFD